MGNPERTLIDVVGPLLEEPATSKFLEEKKAKGRKRWERDDVIWFELLLSMATLRGSQGDQLLMDDEKNVIDQKYGRVAFETIEMVKPERRREYLENALLDGNVRMHQKKAKALASNFDMIKEKWSTPLGAKRAFEDQEGPESKLAFLQQFEQIGPKYARNIGMDLYHPDFHEFIAIDNRIKNISDVLGLPYQDWGFDKLERFYRSVADKLEIQPWELDRVLYRYEEQITRDLE